MDNRKDLERAVIAAANAWDRSRERGRHEYGTREGAQSLIEAVDALREAPLPHEVENSPHLTEVREMARDTLTEWMRRWDGPGGHQYRVSWGQDGTARLEVDDEPVLRFSIAFDIQVVDPPNEPTGEPYPATWGTVPAGYFVIAPDGTAYEVRETRATGDQQMVTLPQGTWARPATGPVTVRRGSKFSEVAEALAALGGGRIMKDPS
jgi:hypothetical protein